MALASVAAGLSNWKFTPAQVVAPSAAEIGQPFTSDQVPSPSATGLVVPHAA